MRRNLDLWLIFALALSLRLIFIWQWWDTPYALSPFLDAKAYDDWAMEIMRGQLLHASAFYQSPLYSYALALLYKINGHSLFSVSIVQAVLGSLTCVIVAYTARIYFGRLAAWGAGLLAAFDRVLIFYTAPALKETLMTLTLAAFVFFALKVVHSRLRRDVLWCGVFLGLTSLLRSNVLALFAVLAVFAIYKFRARALAPLLIAGMATTALILPATLHNWWVSGDFVLINSCGGLTFYAGNSPSATGANSFPPFISSDIAQEEADSKRIAEQELKRKLLPSEVSAYWFHQGLDYFLIHPRRELSLLLHKVWYFWSDREIPDNYDSDFFRREGGTILSWPLISFGWVAILGILGLAMADTTSVAAQMLGAFCLVYMLSVMPFLVSDRYRIPEIIFLLPCAGAALQKMRDFSRASKFAPIGKAVLITLPIVIIAFIPAESDSSASDAFNWGLQAALFSDANRDQESVQAIEKAVRANPAMVGSDAYIKAATSFERLGDMAKSGALLKQATEAHPQDGLTFYNLARFHYEHGDSKAAIDLYNQALMVMPYLYQPYIGLGILYYKQGELALARESVRRGLLIKSESIQLQQLDQLLK